MKRGEIWTVSGGAPYAGKPRPAVIVQEDRFEATSSIMLCVFTTDPTEAPLLRMLVVDGRSCKSAHSSDPAPCYTIQRTILESGRQELAGDSV